MSNKRGTYYEIDQLTKRVEELERTIREFMEKWGPEVQRRRDKRDEVWDEMVRVVSIQKKHQQPKPGYDIHGNKLTKSKPNDDVENH